MISSKPGLPDFARLVRVDAKLRRYLELVEQTSAGGTTPYVRGVLETVAAIRRLMDEVED